MIIGIDPGFATLGYAILSGTNLPKIIDAGTITTKKSSDFSGRISIIYDNLMTIISNYELKKASVEKIFFKTNQKTAIDVAHARGVILLALKKANISIFEYTPLQIKKSITGKGNASKSYVQWMVAKMLSLKETTFQDDTADAIATALCLWYQKNV